MEKSAELGEIWTPEIEDAAISDMAYGVNALVFFEGFLRGKTKNAPWNDIRRLRFLFSDMYLVEFSPSNFLITFPIRIKIKNIVSALFLFLLKLPWPLSEPTSCHFWSPYIFFLNSLIGF
jgi:hypothetical protein